MSALIGPVSGALVAGGVYYGFSNLIQTRTEQHRRDLQALSKLLLAPSPPLHAPPPAAERITHKPFAALLKARWNHELACLFAGASSWQGRVREWGRGALYGYGEPQAAERKTDSEQ